MRSKQAWVLGLASLASFMMALDSLVVTTALSTIRQDLTASIEALEWVVNAYSLALAVLLPTGAALGDRYGRRRVLAAGLAVFTVASAACALSPGIGALIMSRALQGAGAAMVLPLSLTLVSALFPPQERGRAMGLYLGVTGLATFSGPFVGGLVAEGLAWQWIFWLNLPIGLVTILLAVLRVDESRGPGGRFDLGGVVLVSAGAFGVVWALVRGNAAGWGGAEVLGALTLGVALLVAFVFWERRAEAPMLPMRFFRLRVPALIIGSAGLTMAMPAAQKAVVGAVRPHEIGQASGAFMTLRIFGGVFGVAVAVAVFASAGGYASPEEFSAGFSAGMGAVTALAFLGLLVALGMPGGRPAAVAAPPMTREREEVHE
ncbi:MFS transporter [Nonomuraea rubra]|uniref:MFS transporter n=1 Tax=Nonomuraea rubra TaxID=46180 RepID=UPI003405E628